MLINQYDIYTSSGYKTIELWECNILDLENVDLLCFSAFKEAYFPSKGSIIQALEIRLNDVIDRYAVEAEWDYRDSFNCWASWEIENQNFKRIAGIEIDKLVDTDFDFIFQNYFKFISCLSLDGIPISTVSLPLIGTGSLKLNPQEVIQSLVAYSTEAFRSISSLKRIIICSQDRKYFGEINSALNDLIDRSGEELIVLNFDLVPKNVIDKLLNSLSKYIQFSKDKNSSQSLLQGVKTKDLMFYEVALLGRKIIESIIMDERINPKKAKNLNEGIFLMKKNIPSGLYNNLMTLKDYGNIAAHAQLKSSLTPINQQDMLLILISLSKTLEYFLQKQYI